MCGRQNSEIIGNCEKKEKSNIFWENILTLLIMKVASKNFFLKNIDMVLKVEPLSIDVFSGPKPFFSDTLLIGMIY